MASLGLWNLIVIAVVAIVLRQCWRWDSTEKAIWQNSQFLKHPFILKITQVLRQPVIKLLLQVIIILIVIKS